MTTAIVQVGRSQEGVESLTNITKDYIAENSVRGS